MVGDFFYFNQISKFKLSFLIISTIELIDLNYLIYTHVVS